MNERYEGPKPDEQLELWLSEIANQLDDDGQQDPTMLRGWLRFACSTIVKQRDKMNATSKIIDADELAYEFVRIGKRLAAQSKDSRLVTVRAFMDSTLAWVAELQREETEIMDKEETDG